MSHSAQPGDGRRVSRRRFVTGMGAAAVTASVAAPADRAGAAAAAGPSPFPPVPGPEITAVQDRDQMLWQLGITTPSLPPRAADPDRPPNAWPRDPANPEGGWTDHCGHTVERALFGQWVTYDSDAGLAGAAVAPFGDYGPFSHPRYPDIELLRTHDGAPVRSPEDWWTRRRPEILRLVQDNLYGRIPERQLWPAITWSVSPAVAGTAGGFAYTERTVTGTIDVSGYPQIRDVPRIHATMRVPASAQGQPVPVFVALDSVDAIWPFVAPHGYAACGYDFSQLQPDTGGAALSSYIIGLINKGRWRKPHDWGALAAWGWGVSRLIDYFETDPAVDATRTAVQGHSRLGKAALVAAAYDDRIAAVFPSAAGEFGTSWLRRAYGESLELVCGSEQEYHWVAGNAMRYMGELRPGRYWPRRVQELPVDVHCVLALVAPRPVLVACGTDTPPGFGDAWADPRGMFLSGKVASRVWEFLGWPGQIIPAGTAFTSGPCESTGGTPPVGATFTDGTVGWKRHQEGHTPYPDWPAFAAMVSRYFDDARPVVEPGQRLTAGRGDVVGTVAAAHPANAPLGNWQVTGGTGTYLFAVDSGTGQVTVADRRRIARGRRYTLTVTVDDRKLTSIPEPVVIVAAG